MPVVISMFMMVLLSMVLFKSCGKDPSASYQISYGSFLNYTMVKNVHSYTLKGNCITYTYGNKNITETYCGENIEVMPN